MVSTSSPTIMSLFESFVHRRALWAMKFRWLPTSCESDLFVISLNLSAAARDCNNTPLPRYWHETDVDIRENTFVHLCYFRTRVEELSRGQMRSGVSSLPASQVPRWTDKPQFRRVRTSGSTSLVMITGHWIGAP